MDHYLLCMLLDEELSLVTKAKAGERMALGKLYDAITPKLYGYLVNRTRNTQVAEDILQETWAKAIGSLHLFRPQGVRFSAWLFAIARNECRMHWRKTHHETNIDESFDLPTVPDTSGGKLWIDTILNKLSNEEQEILRLRYVADLSFKEVARVLGISLISARVRVHRALKKAHALSSHSSTV